MSPLVPGERILFLDAKSAGYRAFARGFPKSSRGSYLAHLLDFHRGLKSRWERVANGPDERAITCPSFPSHARFIFAAWRRGCFYPANKNAVVLVGHEE